MEFYLMHLELIKWTKPELCISK